NNSGTSYDVFLVKYNSSGTALWSIKAGGNGSDQAYGICVDSDNNCYISGDYASDLIAFGGSVSDLYNVSGLSTRDYFIAKYNSSGVVQWAKSAGGVSNEFARNLIADDYGNIYAAGNFF